jgi:hypothetical protein
MTRNKKYLLRTQSCQGLDALSTVALDVSTSEIACSSRDLTLRYIKKNKLQAYLTSIFVWLGWVGYILGGHGGFCRGPSHR